MSRYHPYKSTDDVKFANEITELESKDARHNVYSRENHIYFRARVNKDSVYQLQKEIERQNRDFDNMSRKYPEYEMKPKPIYLHLYTGGGSCSAGWAAVTFIQCSKIPIHTVIEGYCASAGTIMSVVGKKRYMAEHARMLIHQLSAGVYGKFAEIQDGMKHLEEDMEESIEFYRKHSTMTKVEIRKQLKHDHWWDFNTAKSRGLVDEMWKG